MSETPALAPFAAEHRARYLRSGGTDGHLFDFGPLNGEGLTPCCLIKHVGAKTGRTRILPLIYGMARGEFVLVASKGGAPAHPAWYVNIVDAETVDIQVATQAYRATWREPEGAEYDEIFAEMTAIYPPYPDYQASTDRRIPILLLKPVESIPVFTESDIAD